MTQETKSSRESLGSTYRLRTGVALALVVGATLVRVHCVEAQVATDPGLHQGDRVRVELLRGGRLTGHLTLFTDQVLALDVVEYRAVDRAVLTS